MQNPTFISKEERNSAFGPFQNNLQKQYFLEMDKFFKPMNKPQSGDWLHSHKEKHQTFQDYKLPYYNQVTPQRNIIYLQPFGKFQPEFIQKLIHFCEVFYPTMRVACGKTVDFQKQLSNATCRNNCYGKQYLAQDILAYIEKNVPKDAYCVMGITLNDIYPGPNWNYVYGWAKYVARVGIFSFIRWDETFAEGKREEIDWDMILYPSMRTMVHEIGHMFGVTHCVYSRCLMNGFNCIEENYLNPLEFCPICFRKILKNIGFDVKERYLKLIQFCKASSMKELKQDLQLYEKLQKLNGNVANQKDVKIQNKMGLNRTNFSSKTNARGKSLQVFIKPKNK